MILMFLKHVVVLRPQLLVVFPPHNIDVLDEFNLSMRLAAKLLISYGVLISANARAAAAREGFLRS